MLKNAEIIEKIKDTWLESAVKIRDLFDEEVVKKEKSCLMVKHIQVKQFYLLWMKSPHGQKIEQISP